MSSVESVRSVAAPDLRGRGSQSKCGDSETDESRHGREAAGLPVVRWRVGVACDADLEDVPASPGRPSNPVSKGGAG